MLGLGVVAGCRARESAPAREPGTPASERSDPAIVFLGTSLTAGLGLDPDQAYPALIQRKLEAEGRHWRVVNAGVSGESSAGARRRVEWLLRQPVSVLVVETGANDGLRAQDVDAMRANIQAVIDHARQASPAPKLLLLGMEAPPNLGADYGVRFRQVYRDLAQANGVPLVPFLLAGVAGVPALNQADGIHPTAEGQERIAATVWEALRPLL